jgi:multifunctional methyltransferase subunit TRM112
MRLLVHNFLQCHVRNCANTYPLQLHVEEWSDTDSNSTFEYNRATALRLLPKVEWPVLLHVVSTLRLPVSLPADKPDEASSDEVLEAMMSVLVGRQVKSGVMTCSGCGHVYPIKDAIPNMLLNEDEI